MLLARGHLGTRYTRFSKLTHNFRKNWFKIRRTFSQKQKNECRIYYVKRLGLLLTGYKPSIHYEHYTLKTVDYSTYLFVFYWFPSELAKLVYLFINLVLEFQPY